MNGFIKLHRQITDWGWYKDANTMRVFLHLLITANWEESDFLGHKIERGQVAFGRKELAKALDLTEKQVRTAVIHLVNTGELVTKRAGKFSIGTIVNFSKYQDSVLADSTAQGQKRAIDGPDKGGETATSKNRRSKEVYMHRQPRQAAWSGSRYGRDQEYVAEWDVPLWTSKGKVTDTE